MKLKELLIAMHMGCVSKATAFVLQVGVSKEMSQMHVQTKYAQSTAENMACVRAMSVSAKQDGRDQHVANPSATMTAVVMARAPLFHQAVQANVSVTTDGRFQTAVHKDLR